MLLYLEFIYLKSCINMLLFSKTLGSFSRTWTSVILQASCTVGRVLSTIQLLTGGLNLCVADMLIRVASTRRFSPAQVQLSGLCSGIYTVTVSVNHSSQFSCSWFKKCCPQCCQVLCVWAGVWIFVASRDSKMYWMPGIIISLTAAVWLWWMLRLTVPVWRPWFTCINISL